MKVFADFHHDDMFHSLKLLFEKRLGWELYSPIGMGWYTEGWWKYSAEPKVVHQYLGPGKKWEDKGDYCEVENPTHECTLKALTLDQFKEMKFDIMLCSVPEHTLLYSELAKKYQPQAKVILQVGNEWKDLDPGPVKNLMISCAPFEVNDDRSVVFYHQEFDLDQFNYERGMPENPIQSFVNDLPNLKDWKLFLRYESKLPRWVFHSYGLGCRDGNVRPLSKLVKEMKASSFIFHAKSLGDGFGHIIHNIFALGRPGLIRTKWYKDRAAEPLFEDQVTCIDLDARTFEANCELIEHFSKPELYHKMCKNARQRFEEVVNYDAEFEEIKKFLDRLQ